MINAMNIGAFSPRLYSDPYMFDDIDLMSYSTSAPLLGGSIFGAMPPMPMMGLGMGYNPQQYYDYMRQNQQFSVDYNIDHPFFFLCIFGDIFLYILYLILFFL